MKKIISALTALSLIISSVAVMPVNAESAAMPANPVISRNVPAYSAVSSNPNQGNDEHYFTFWQSTAPDYLAYDLSSVPEENRKKVIAVWYNTSSYDSIGQYVSRSAEPEDYVIELNSAAGGEYPEDGWEIVKTVSGNPLCSRQCLIDMDGYNWIRIRITKSAGDSISFNFDIHDASQGVYDSWIFFGDSITAGGMMNCYGTGFAEYVNQIDSKYYPVQENGGIGGISSYHGSENIDRWLSDSSAKYVSIAYGTNDAWGNQSGTDRYYESTKYMIDAVLDLGKIPVLPTIPYSTNPDVNSYLDDYMDMIYKLYDEYGDKLVHGANFYTFFKENPDLLSGDGVHPSSEGYDAMRKYWAETMYKTVYQSAENTNPPESESVKGDVNADGKFNIADMAVLKKYLLDIGTLADEKSGDLCKDNEIDILDLCVMKRMLIQGDTVK